MANKYISEFCLCVMVNKIAQSRIRRLSRRSLSGAKAYHSSVHTLAGLAAFLLLASLAPGQDAAGGAAPPEPAAAASPDSAIDSLCSALISESQQVYRLLCEVSDKESADRIAPILKEKLHLMADRLQALETLPFEHEQDTEALKSHMASLTHMSQINLATMQRLVEVNAYGSEALMAIFTHFKVESKSMDHLDSDDLPQAQLYGDLADGLENAIFTLRQIQNEAQALAALEHLRAQLSKIETAHNHLTILAPAHTDEQKEALRPVRERLLQLSSELKDEISRLQAAKCYLCSELDALLPRLLRLAAS